MYRIKALEDFSDVEKGEVGGYIESEQNLSQEGDARVSGTACISGDTWIAGNARITGDARIFSSNSVVWFSNIGTENGTLTVYCSKNGLMATRGCFTGSVDDFF